LGAVQCHQLWVFMDECGTFLKGGCADPGIRKRKTVGGFQPCGHFKQRPVFMDDLHGKRPALLVSQAAGGFIFIFPDAVQYFHKRDKTDKT